MSAFCIIIPYSGYISSGQSFIFLVIDWISFVLIPFFRITDTTPVLSFKNVRPIFVPAHYRTKKTRNFGRTKYTPLLESIIIIIYILYGIIIFAGLYCRIIICNNKYCYYNNNNYYYQNYYVLIFVWNNNFFVSLYCLIICNNYIYSVTFCYNQNYNY